MKAITNRVKRLEGHIPDSKLTIERVMIDCEGQARNPELYNRVPTGEGMFELEPKDPTYTCKCRMCKNG